eukprot:COSAG02_NODE_23844_length_706_cov_1.179572_2_plen_35_part_01
MHCVTILAQVPRSKVYDINQTNNTLQSESMCLYRM